MLDEYICQLVSHGNGVYEYEPTGEIVRCKDCKWYNPSWNILGGKRPEGRCDYEGVWVIENDYCSKGERGEWREDAT